MLGLEYVYDMWFGSKKKAYTVKQEDLINDVTSVCQGITTSIIPCLENMIATAEKDELSKIESLDFVSKELGSKGPVEALITLNEVLLSIVDGENIYKRMIGNVFSNVTTDKTITIRELGVMNLVDTLSILEAYTYDLIFDIDSHLSSNFEISKMTRNRMLKYVDYYVKIVKYFKGKDAKKIVSAFEDLSSNTVYDVVQLPEGMKEEVLKEENSSEGLLDSVKHFLGFGKSPVTKSGFIGNPIYHLGMMWVDFQKHRNDKRILAKQATEQILLELKMKRTDSYDPKIEKQIEFYSQRLHELEYKIAQYEKQS